MRDQLLKLDARLVDGWFQPCADWISERVALDCHGVARLCIDLAALAWVLSQAPGMIAAVQAGFTAPAMTRMSLLFVVLAAIMVLRTVFQRPGGTGGANPLRGGLLLHRLLLLAWAGGMVVRLMGTLTATQSWELLAFAICGTAGAYFASCSTRPPQRRTYAGGRGWKPAGAS